MVLKRYKRPLLIVVSLLVSLAAVLYFLNAMRGGWTEMAQAFSEADYLYLVPAVGVLALMYALRVLRWRVFLSPIQRVPYSHILSATCIGFMSTCVLPLRPGEVIRPYVLHRKSGIDFGHAAGTAMGLERLFDLMGLCFLLVLTGLALWAHAGMEQTADAAEFTRQLLSRGMFFGALTAAGLVCLGIVAFFPDFMLRVAGLLVRPLPRPVNEALMGFLRSMAQALGFLKSPVRVAAALLLSFCVWTCFPLSTWALARGFSLDLPLAGVLVTQVIVTAAVALPQAPSFFGVFQVAAAKGAAIFGTSQGDAGAFAMMLWAVNVVPITAVGLGLLWYEGLNLRNLARLSQRSAGETEATEG
ncbi:MAG: lysylphosphatidylglycerol synthase transmembrane domain-containing protein [Planctomycetota bacterium]|jgi:uncharacterized protein (TIRG00374 family)